MLPFSTNKNLATNEVAIQNTHHRKTKWLPWSFQTQTEIYITRMITVNVHPSKFFGIIGIYYVVPALVLILSKK